MKKAPVFILLVCWTPQLWAGTSNPDEPPPNVPVVNMIYATDRPLVNGIFGNGARGTSITYGTCDYAPELNYRRQDGGNLYWLATPGATPNPNPGYSKPNEKGFDSGLTRAGGKTFVFIHGVNTSFTDAVERTAQIAYDLQLDGIPIVYTWPSADSFWMSPQDLVMVRSAPCVQDCVTFLEKVLGNAGSKKVYLIAHSLGSNLLCRALLKLDDQYLRRIGEVVLIAPGIGQGEFKGLFGGSKGLEKKYVERNIKIVVYASPHDAVLHAGQLIFKDSLLGESGPYLTLLPGLTMIDTQEISYGWGLSHDLDSHDGVIDDMYLDLDQGIPLEERLVTQHMGQGNVPFYELFDGVHEHPTFQEYNFASAEKFYFGANGLKDVNELVDWFGVVPDGSFERNYSWETTVGLSGFQYFQVSQRINLATGHVRPHIGLSFDWNTDLPGVTISCDQEAGLEFVTDDGLFADPGIAFQDQGPITDNHLFHNVAVNFVFRFGHYFYIPI